MLPPAANAALRPSTAGAITVGCLDSSWAFTAIHAEWTSLLRASAANSPFLTWEWLHTWWAHLGQASQLRIATVRADGELVALAPFCLTDDRLAMLARLDMLGTGEAGSDYLDVIVRDGYEADSLRALGQFFKTQNTTLRLTHVAPTATAASLAENLVAEGWCSTTTPGGICPYIPLAGHTWDSYLATLGSSHRANVRRRLRAIERAFEMSFERVTTEAQRQEALGALVSYHERRFSERGTAFATSALRTFHDEVTRRALDLGWLRMFVLRLNGAPAAVMYGFLYSGRFYFYQHGFDDQYQQHSVGLVLMALSIRTAIDEGASEFDLLWGTESYKSLWARDTRELRNIQLFPPNLGGRIQRNAFSARRRLGALARRVRTATTRGHHGS